MKTANVENQVSQENWEPIVEVCRRMLAKRQDDEHAIEVLEGLLNSVEDLPDGTPNRQKLAAAEILEGVYRMHSQWSKLANVLEIQLGEARVLELRLEFLTKLRELYEGPIGDSNLAFGAAARAFREKPSDAGLRSGLEGFAERQARWEELVAIYLDVAEQNPGKAWSVELRERIARFCEKKLLDRDEAIRQWEHVLEYRGPVAEVLFSLERLYRQQGRHQDLVDTFRSLAGRTHDVGQKKDLLFGVAGCLAEDLRDTNGAVAILKRILDLDPVDIRAHARLNKLLVASKRWNELVDTLGGQPSASPQPKVTQVVPGPTPFRSNEEYRNAIPCSVEFLEQLLENKEMRYSAAQHLEPFFRKTGDFAKLLRVLEIYLLENNLPEERLGIFKEMMRIFEEELKQDHLAFVVACRAFKENLEEPSVRMALERLASRLGLVEELALVFESVIDKTPYLESGPAIMRRLAQLKENQTDEVEEAIPLWEKILSAKPGDREALGALRRLYRAEADHSALAEILSQMAEQEQDPERKKDIFYELACVQEEKLGQRHQAMGTYLEILNIDPEEAPARNMIRMCLSQIKDLA